jgi:hypothetical protein
MSGPIIKDTGTLALGLAQVRVVASATNIAKTGVCSTASDSIGALATTKFSSSVDYWRHESGFPLKEDQIYPLREKAHLECQFEEIKPYTMALARGFDPTTETYTATSGEVTLGNLAAPEYVRMEAQYTFPAGTNYMYIIFPRAQVSSVMEIDLAKEDNAKPTLTFESKIASSDVTGGNAVWNSAPLGHIIFV